MKKQVKQQLYSKHLMIKKPFKIQKKKKKNVSISQRFGLSEIKTETNERTIQVTTESFEDEITGLTWNITNLPGQAEYYATNSLFISLNNSLIILVLRMWLDFIQYDSKIINNEKKKRIYKRTNDKKYRTITFFG